MIEIASVERTSSPVKTEPPEYVPNGTAQAGGTENMHNTERLSSHSQYRIVQLIEVACFAMGGWCVYAYGPFWMYPDAVNGFMTAILVFGGFAAYIAVRGQRARRRVAVVSTVVRPVLHPLDDPVEFDSADFASAEDSAVSTPSIAGGRYQVPRRYSLRSIILLTVAVALLTVMLRALHTPTRFAMIILAFFAVVGLMQAVLQNVPRRASILVGVVFGTLLAMQMYYTTRGGRGPGIFGGTSFLHVFVISLLWGGGLGACVGYLSGTLAAGIFLLGDSFDSWWSPSPRRDLRDKGDKGPT